MKLLDALFGNRTAFTWRRATYYDANRIDNAAQNAFEQFTPNLTPPFDPENGQGRVWGGVHFRRDLMLTAPGLLTLQRVTPLFDFEQIDDGNMLLSSGAVEAGQVE